MSLSVSMSSVVLAAGNWWEPGTPNALDIGDLSAFLAFMVGLTAAFFGITKWWMKLLRAVIREEIEIATEPIHPNSNGGLSLADVARKTKDLEVQVEKISSTADETKDLLIKVLSLSAMMPIEEPTQEKPKATRSRTRKTA